MIDPFSYELVAPLRDFQWSWGWQTSWSVPLWPPNLSYNRQLLISGSFTYATDALHIRSCDLGQLYLGVDLESLMGAWNLFR